ncbi:vitamin B12 ABC transporter ATP-binding protein BtuD [Photobacterium toruni]|uniref:vitamin B12 ABC transporter ATP-binding protein BtuD n=1 Tax=Photobacterium toruni TaxID=1935446 RepID=UPI00210F68B2|nr:vitamin B12 ABC transporter ATP-binding protein BtuD [Photobacterium toruni]MEC6814233.1 vitamin B12 ABC transporter ATP-binding protein BtuD [Photobacterium toruni]
MAIIFDNTAEVDSTALVLHAQNIAFVSRLLPMSLTLYAGQITHVIGPNGSGKSTVLSILSGLFAHKGSIKLLDIDLVDYDLLSLAQVRSYLSQQDKPNFSIPVFQYLSLAISALHDIEADKLQIALNEICQSLDIKDKLSRNIQQLSGGEWQRVRLAAACLQVWPAINPQAKLLLLDEPAAALDIGQEAAMYQLVRKISQQGITVVMVNHDLNRTLREADNVVLLDQGQCVGCGHVDQIMTIDNLQAVFKTGIDKIEHHGVPCLIFVD